MKTGAVIAAAGMSSRMKAFKPMLEFGSSTIIRTVISSLQSAGINEIVVITGHNAGMLEDHILSAGVTCLFNNEYKTTDMFYSAKIGLDYIKNKCDRVFFLPGDVPLFSKKSLIFMQKYMSDSGCKIILPLHDGIPGHPILIDHCAIPSLLSYNGSSGLKGAIDSFDGFKETIRLDDIGMTLDADYPEDYEKLKVYLRRKPDDTDTADV